MALRISGNLRRYFTLVPSTHVRYRQEIFLDQCECTFEAWAHLESRTPDGDAARAGGQQTSFSLFTNDWLYESPGLRDFSSDYDHLGVHAVDQTRDSDTQVSCRFAHRFGCRRISGVH